MAIKAQCPNGHSITAKDSLAGQTRLCPKCQVPFTIPRPEMVIDDDLIDRLVFSLENAQIGGAALSDTSPPDEETSTALSPSGQPFVQQAVACSKCGSHVSDLLKFCPRCGNPMKGERPSPQRTPDKGR